MILKRIEAGRFTLLLQNEMERRDPKREYVSLIIGNELQFCVVSSEIEQLHSAVWDMLDTIENDCWRDSDANRRRGEVITP